MEIRILAAPVPQAERTLMKELTGRELSIVYSILGGSSNADIARARGTSARTVANQVAAILRKLRVRSRRELFALAHSNVPQGELHLLTSRERQVVERAARGASNKCIACELGVSSNTVGVLFARARKKLHRSVGTIDLS